MSSGTGNREQCEHIGLVEDCEIAVCQGKTRGQLWAPIAERVGRDSWKEAPFTEQRKAACDFTQTPVYPSQLFCPFDLVQTSPSPFCITIFTHVQKLSCGLSKCLTLLF